MPGAIAITITAGYNNLMKTLSLSGKYKDTSVLLDDKDYEYFKRWKWNLTNSGYVCRAASTGKLQPGKTTYKYKTLYMHREIMQPVGGQEIDHINQDRLDNRRKNLRTATHKQNIHNAGSRGGISKFKGVHFDDRMGHKKWHASITIDGVHKSLKYFMTEAEAARAYDMAALKHHGKFARLNHA